MSNDVVLYPDCGNRDRYANIFAFSILNRGITFGTGRRNRGISSGLKAITTAPIKGAHEKK
jgi:hypothetical protein